MQKSHILLCALIIFILGGCKKEAAPTPLDLNAALLFPAPHSITATGSSFHFSDKVTMSKDENVDAFIPDYLSGLVYKSTGHTMSLAKASAKNNIHFALNEALDINEDGYKLDITPDKISIEARENAGLFRAIQSLRQMMPDSIEAHKLQQPLKIPSGEILDAPIYTYRGAMLDVARHFFSVEDVKRFIDFLAMYKMNHLHLHLSDDQGWRIEILNWPNLTKHGGSTEVGGGPGGFYTQEEFKDIVAYAAQRYITIVPEIDMPGHTNAALASYPSLNCDDIAPELYTGTEVGFSSLCPRKRDVYRFVEDVISEIAMMCPGPYIHIGGDESNATDPEEYKHFISKVEMFVNKNRRQMLGWDDIVASKLSASTITQHWAKEENAKEAVNQNLKIIMSPAKKAYLDMKYDSTTKLGLSWAGLIEVDDAYNWEPSNYIEGVNAKNVIGIEAPLWTETVTNMDELEYMVFPRLIGYAEIGWRGDSKALWENYRSRLEKHGKRLEIMGIDFYRSSKVW